MCGVTWSRRAGRTSLLLLPGTRYCVTREQAGTLVESTGTQAAQRQGARVLGPRAWHLRVHAALPPSEPRDRHRPSAQWEAGAPVPTASANGTLLLSREQPAETWGPQVSTGGRRPAAAWPHRGFLPSQRAAAPVGTTRGDMLLPWSSNSLLGGVGGWVGGLSLLGTSGPYLHGDSIHSLA